MCHRLQCDVGTHGTRRCGGSETASACFTTDIADTARTSSVLVGSVPLAEVSHPACSPGRRGLCAVRVRVCLGRMHDQRERSLSTYIGFSPATVRIHQLCSVTALGFTRAPTGTDRQTARLHPDVNPFDALEQSRLTLSALPLLGRHRGLQPQYSRIWRFDNSSVMGPSESRPATQTVYTHCYRRIWLCVNRIRIPYSSESISRQRR